MTGEAVAVQRLATLLQAGIAPVAAWRALAATPDAPPVAQAMAAEGISAHDIPDLLAAEAVREGGWSSVAAAWRVAERAGSPLGPTLARLAEVLRREDDAERQVRTALAGPLATARILVLLPIAGLLLGVLLGFDTPRILATTPAGWACLVVGGALLGGAFAWMRSLTRGARRRPPHPGLAADLTAIALGGGLGPDAAGALARSALERVGVASGDDLDATLDFARAAGVPAAALLRAEADDARRAAASEGERRAAALGVRLMLPLGLCILPAFVVLGVAPILISLIGSMRLG